MSELPTKPFGSIALALSGGGYRAAAFHLGLLRTLRDAGLLEDVAILSTVSGGTFVGAAYAVARGRGQTFDEFFLWFRERLRVQRPVHRAAELLVSNPNAKLPRCTLIVAQAEAIDEQFFNGCRFSELFEHPTHLQEITFNATDFRVGLPFRFQKSRSTRVKIGNGKHAIPLEIAKQLRMADIVAASSCFPGGFEPLGFPQDFQWPDRAAALQQLRELGDNSPFSNPIPLMDGGVADNQGLGSLLAAIERRKPGDDEVGLVLISDADQAPSRRPLLEHQRDPQPTGLRIGTVLLLARVLAWVGVIASVLLGWRLANMLATRHFGSWFFFVETVFSLLVVVAAVIALAWSSRVLRQLIWDRVPRDAGIDIVGTIQQTTTGSLGELVWMRLESLFAMANSVFMKNLRDLRYRGLFSDDEYRGRIVANLIYDLASPRRRTDAVVEPSAEMRRIAERARDMPTCLWVDNELQLQDAILCGRFTTCFNLLRHLAELPAESPDKRGAVRSKLESLWRELETEIAAGSNQDHSIQPPPSTRSAA